MFGIVDAVALGAARQNSTASIAVRALWLDAGILIYQAANAYYLVNSGQWQQLVTRAPLTASPGAGLILVTIGIATMLLAIVRISALVRGHRWLSGE